MPLRGSASCATFDASTRKVPSLALTPHGHLQHASRANKKVAGQVQKTNSDQSRQRDEDKLPSPPLPARRQTLNGTLGEAAPIAIRHAPSPVRQQDKQHQHRKDQSGEGERGEEVKENEDSDDDAEAELRLGERFLNMMALMARLASQSLGDNNSRPTNPASPLVRSNAQRLLSPIAPLTPSLPPPVSPPQRQHVKAPLKSPKHVVHEVAERLPAALRGPLTFDICMLLPTPIDERQSPLKSPIRRKRLRKRLRRRRLRRRPRRTWQASHASWQPHASAEYIVDHSRQDFASISATRLVERLGERKLNTQTLPRVISMPLPPLHRNNTHEGVTKSTESVGDGEPDTYSDGGEQDIDDQDNYYYVQGEDDDQEQEEDIDDGSSSSQSEKEETPLSSDNTAATASFSPQEVHVLDVDRTAVQNKKRPLYHQPAWISPELHAWLVAFGLFATKPRRELL